MRDKTPIGNPKSSVDIVAMQNEVKEWIEAKGWLDDRSFGDQIALLISESIEALEAYRSHDFEEWESHQPIIDGVKMPKMTKEQFEAIEDWIDGVAGVSGGLDPGPPRREGVAAEFAGIFVRLLDSCGRLGFDLGTEFRKEMDYNWTRAHRHGGKAL